MRAAAVLHAADCHLGAGSERGAEEDAFVRLLELARRERIDALLIAGDLFDSARVSRDLVLWTGAQLDALSCDVVILPGNHDCLSGGSPYTGGSADWCRSARVITDPDGELIHIATGRIVVWGRPCVDHVPSFRPLAGLPPRPGDALAVVMAHGLFVRGSAEETVRGSPIHEWELDGVDWDYVALGHQGRYRCVRESPPVVYAGETCPGGTQDGSAVLVRAHGGSVAFERCVLPAQPRLPGLDAPRQTRPTGGIIQPAV
jgi:exonuclease SbcD